MAYDALNRVTSVTDPLQNTVSYQYDPVGNVSVFTDPRSNALQYSYDAVNRLQVITYPDTTTEQFAWDPVGNLQTYTDNHSQQRTFTYDNANRLIKILYSVDSTTVTLALDQVGNILNRKERNGDVTAFVYDATYRTIAAQRLPASGSVTWYHVNFFDAYGNRTELDSGSTPVYNTGVYNTDIYATSSKIWTVSGAYDARGRMPGYTDRNSKTTTFSYDVENRRTQISYPNTTTTTASYDMVGRLLSLNTPSFLSITYTYDLASNRTSVVVGNDTIDYQIDASGRLTEERTNRLVERSADRFALGTASQLQLNQSPDNLSLLAYGDTFSGNVLSADRWRITNALSQWENGSNNPGYVGLEVRQNNGLNLAFPRGYTDTNYQSGSQNNYGFSASALWTAVQHRITLSGDFDIQVSFAEFQGQQSVTQQVTGTIGISSNQVTNLTPTDAYKLYVGDTIVHTAFAAGTTITALSTPDNGVTYKITVSNTSTNSSVLQAAVITVLNQGEFYCGLGVFQTPFEQEQATHTSSVIVSRSSNPIYGTGGVQIAQSYKAEVYQSGTQQSPLAYVPTSDTSGKLRIARTGTTVNMYWWNNTTSQWVLFPNAPYTGWVSNAMYLGLILYGNPRSTGSSQFQNFTCNTPSTAYPTSGTFTSGVYDASRSVTWGALSWTATTPGTSSVKLQVAVSSTPNPSSYVGPDGTAATFFTTSGTSMASIPSGRYIRYQVSFAGDGTVTPTLSDVEASYSYSGSNTSTLLLYGYDAAGNMTSKTTVTDSGTATDVRDSGSWSSPLRINNLNQVLQQIVTQVSGSYTTYAYAYDSDGNMLSKTPTIVGTLQSGQPTVTGVSTSDLAQLYVGAAITNSNLPANTTVSSIGSGTFTMNHNANASVTATINVTGQAVTFTWNDENRLTQVSKAGTSAYTVQYTYDSLGRMLTRYDGTNTTTFEWDGMNMIRETTGAISTTYYAPLGELVGFDIGGTSYFVHTDALGSVRKITDNTGAVVSTFDYDAWGNALPSTSDGISGGFAYRFVGALGVRYDSTTGLYYMRQRWYDAAGLQRFISRDPLGLAAGPNSYAYVKNAPTNNIDPSGLGPSLGASGVPPAPPQPPAPSPPSPNYNTNYPTYPGWQGAPVPLTSQCQAVLQQMQTIQQQYVQGNLDATLTNLGFSLTLGYLDNKPCGTRAGELAALFRQIPGVSNCFNIDTYPVYGGLHAEVAVTVVAPYQAGGSTYWFDPSYGYMTTPINYNPPAK